MKCGYSRLIALAGALFLLPQMAHAAPIVSLTFTQPVQSALQGGFLTFTGTLSVTGDPDPVYIFGDFVATSPGFGLVGFDDPLPNLIMLDDFPFLLNFPSQISSDDSNGPSSSTFDFLTVSIGAQVLPGTYVGTFEVLGGPSQGDSFTLASSTFQIDVQPAAVPEPSSFVLMIAGCVAGIGFWKGRR
jgi:hypothetical protein